MGCGTAVKCQDLQLYSGRGEYEKCTLSLFLLVCLTMLTQTVCCASESGKGSEYVDFAILSTTDMHGKCWETNIINAGVDGSQAIEYSIYSDCFTTYRLSNIGVFVFIIYELSP